MAAPPQIVELIHELARCTKRGELDWYAPPDEVWATEQVYPGSPLLGDVVYPTTPVFTTFNAALLQAQVRDSADSANMINDVLDALRGA